MSVSRAEDLLGEMDTATKRDTTSDAVPTAKFLQGVSHQRHVSVIGGLLAASSCSADFIQTCALTSISTYYGTLDDSNQETGEHLRCCFR